MIAIACGAEVRRVDESLLKGGVAGMSVELVLDGAQWSRRSWARPVASASFEVRQVTP